MNKDFQIWIESHLSDDLPEDARNSVVEATAILVRNNLPKRRPRSPTGMNSISMMVGMADHDQVFSLKPRNFLPSLLDPSKLRNVVLAAAALATGVPGWLAMAFLLITTASRRVNFAEACLLHWLWANTETDRLFDEALAVSSANDLANFYRVVKNSNADILSYIDRLERLGAIEGADGSYRLVETIHILY